MCMYTVIPKNKFNTNAQPGTTQIYREKTAALTYYIFEFRKKD